MHLRKFIKKKTPQPHDHIEPPCNIINPVTFISGRPPQKTIILVTFVWEEEEEKERNTLLRSFLYCHRFIKKMYSNKRKVHYNFSFCKANDPTSPTIHGIGTQKPAINIYLKIKLIILQSCLAVYAHGLCLLGLCFLQIRKTSH